MFKKTIITILIFSLLALPVRADVGFFNNVAGKILLQVESRGEAWYVRPSDLKKYYLGGPDDAFNLMRLFSVGITNNNLNKIPVGLADYSGADTDSDGLTDGLETALGSDGQNTDTDGDGFDDKTEIVNGYNPLAGGKLPLDLKFSQANAGKIFLQVEGRGECWYVNPADGKRYFLSTPAQALIVMKKLGLGITNDNLAKIVSGYFYGQTAAPAAPSAPVCSDCASGGDNGPISLAAAAIRANNAAQAANYFTDSLKPIIEYTMGFLTADGRLAWSQMLAGSSLLSSAAAEKIYRNYVYFQGEKIEIRYRLEEQADGNWLITNI